MQKIMDVLGIYFMIILCSCYVLHLWFATPAVSGLRNIYEIFMKYLSNIHEIFMFLYALHVCCSWFFYACR